MRIIKTGFIASVALLLLQVVQTLAQMPICNVWHGETYDQAKIDYPHLSEAISVVQQQGTVPWFPDTGDVAMYNRIINTMKTCGQNTKIPIVIYGIPNKDCEANYSNHGVNKNMADYQAFIGRLADSFPTENMLYIVEPDALGISINGRCGAANGYPEYVKYALEKLSENPNAELYLDIGFWTLLPSGNPTELAALVNQVWPVNGGGMKGIALNVANTETTQRMIDVCASFGEVTGRSEMKCIIDTSRNYLGPAASGEWCNARGRGMGVPPTTDTGNARAAYYLWVKPPGESDGTCEGQTSGDAMIGPPAGSFFAEAFQMLWNNGYFMNSGTPPPGPTSAPVPTPAPGPGNPCATPPLASCGNSHATLCCPMGTYCQPWDPNNYQCIATPPKCSVQITDTALPGNDIMVVYVDLPSKCCDACLSTSGCMAYTFINSHPTLPPACYLKNGVGETSRVVGAASGILDRSSIGPVPAPTPAPSSCSTPIQAQCGTSVGTDCCPSGTYCQPWDPTYYQCIATPHKCSVQITDTALPGNDLMVVYLDLPSKCCDACASTSGCRAYTFINSHPNLPPACYLKSGVGGTSRVVGAASGILD